MAANVIITPTHARDLDKMGAQGRANQDLTITKAIVAPRKPEEKEPNIEAGVGYNALTDERDRQNLTPTPVEQPVLPIDELPATQPIDDPLLY